MSATSDGYPLEPTGWPHELAQDVSPKLSRALAGKPDAMLHAREAAAAIAAWQPAAVAPDWLLRTKVADLLHLLEFSSISTATGGDDRQAQRVMVDLKRMLAAAPSAAPAHPVALLDGLRAPDRAALAKRHAEAFALFGPAIALKAKRTAAAPPPPADAQSVREALTDAEIEALMAPWAKEQGWHEYERNDLIAGVRAVLAASITAATAAKGE